MAMPAEVCAVVAGFLELASGIPADVATLETLLAEILSEGCYARYRGTTFIAAPRLIIVVQGRKANRKLEMKVYAPVLKNVAFNSGHDVVFECLKPATTDGLLACFSEAKAVYKEIARGLCGTCASAEPPRKKLKGPGFPVCIDCALSASFGF